MDQKIKILSFGRNLCYHLHPETISPLSADLSPTMSMFKIVYRDSALFPERLSLFCLLWLSSASADRMGYITNFCSMIELPRAQKQQLST